MYSSLSIRIKHNISITIIIMVLRALCLPSILVTFHVVLVRRHPGTAQALSSLCTEKCLQKQKLDGMTTRDQYTKAQSYWTGTEGISICVL